MAQGDLMTVLEELPAQYLLSAATFVGGILVGYLVSQFVRRLLLASGVDESVEGTAFDRTARGLGTSTVGLLSQLVAFTIYVVAALISLRVLGLVVTSVLWTEVGDFLPRLFIATLAVIVGLVVGDKVSLLISERLKSVKVPDAGFLPALARYSIIYVALLIALAQIGVAVTALVVLLAAYAIALVFLGGLAFKDLMAAGAAGIYLLLAQPYSIGDEIRIEEQQGIVQEVDVFTTHIERDGEEFIVPNHLALRSGIVRIRN